MRKNYKKVKPDKEHRRKAKKSAINVFLRELIKQKEVRNNV